ncbi:MAG: MaoC family dehydratase [Actinomycetia bacterium]|nr:MaoC family dehydratase [Actinomycetes bacterium]
MANVKFDDLNVGDEIPALTTEPVSRHTLALYCGASGDHNPIHVDTDFAKASGFEDVFAHGMLSMGYLGRVLTDWVPQSQIRKLDGRFISITHIHDVVTCKGKVAEKKEVDGEQRVRLDIVAENQKGEGTVVGSAEIALD